MTHLQQTVLLLRLEFALYAVHETVWILTVAFALYAGWLDLRTRRIPNWLTVSGLVAGLAVNSILGGWYDAKVSLEGAGLALGIFLPLVLLRGIGAGDWKLMGAVGALMGVKPILLVLLASFLVSGMMALIQVLLTKRVRTTARNMLVLVQGFLIFGLRSNPEISLDNPTLLKLPFGVAVAVATVLIFTMSHWATNWQW
jgi:prepilin peptidase CpaA